MTTIVCPTCQQEHALYYYVHANGSKTLNYICNKQKRYEVLTKHGATDGWRYSTKVMVETDFQCGLPIPVKWSPQYAKAQQAAQYAKAQQAAQYAKALKVLP